MHNKTAAMGTLYLVPAFLDPSTPAERVIPSFNEKIISPIRDFVVEDLRSARRFLRACGFKENFEKVNFSLLNEHTPARDTESFLAPAKEGRDMALLSEAGCPAIADPGANLVHLAHRLKIKVVPLAGPSSILLALMASGMNGQNFAFCGYLPKDQAGRIKKIRELERESAHKNQTQIFIETPYRNRHLFSDLVSSCGESTLLCIAAGITTEKEFIKTLSVKEWKKETAPIPGVPAVFLLYKP